MNDEHGIAVEEEATAGCLQKSTRKDQNATTESTGCCVPQVSSNNDIGLVTYYETDILVRQWTYYETLFNEKRPKIYKNVRK